MSTRVMRRAPRGQDRRPRGVKSELRTKEPEHGRTELRAMQAPIKDRYKCDPGAGTITLKAQGLTRRHEYRLQGRDRPRACGRRAASGDGRSGMELCSGDMLLEALVACAGVTLKAVSTALEIPLKSGTVSAKAISISAARWASTRMPRSGSARSASFRRRTDAPRRNRPVAQAHRALLRGLSDHLKRNRLQRRGPRETLISLWFFIVIPEQKWFTRVTQFRRVAAFLHLRRT